MFDAPFDQDTKPYVFILEEKKPKEIFNAFFIPKQKLQVIAEEILTLFDHGFQWKDLAKIMALASNYLDQLFIKDSQEKRDNVIEILDYIIDHTDTPNLPDKISDPLFKEMARGFISLIIPNETEDLHSLEKISGTPTEKQIFSEANNIYSKMKEDFERKNLKTLAYHSIRFSNQYKNLTPIKKKSIAKKYFNYLIEKSNISDCQDDLIFQQLAHPFIDYLVDETN